MHVTVCGSPVRRLMNDHVRGVTDTAGAEVATAGAGIAKVTGVVLF
jgi:hypothetical protein